MNIELKKKEITAEIENLQDEKVLWAISRLLHLDDEGEVPEWHKEIVRERVERYERGDGKMLNWDEVQKEL